MLPQSLASGVVVFYSQLYCGHVDPTNGHNMRKFPSSRTGTFGTWFMVVNLKYFSSGWYVSLWMVT